MKQEFTIADAFQVQQENLYAWSLILNNEAYRKLLTKVRNANEGINSPYQVPRGSDISAFVNVIMKDMLNEG